MLAMMSCTIIPTSMDDRSLVGWMITADNDLGHHSPAI